MGDRRVVAPQLRLASREAGEELSLRGEFAHYMHRVLRLEVSEHVELCDGSNNRWRAQILSSDGDELRCALVEELAPMTEAFPVYLAQGLPKGDKFDLILRQGTEVGVAGFVPFVSKRSIVRLDEKRAARRLERWERIVREAARQSGRGQVPEVTPLCESKQLFAALPPGLPVVVCWEGAQDRPLKAWIDSHKAPQGIVVVIGPEGGFAPQEVAWMEEAGAQVVGLGPLILRTETAGVAVASLLQYAYGVLGGMTTVDPAGSPQDLLPDTRE